MKQQTILKVAVCLLVTIALFAAFTEAQEAPKPMQKAPARAEGEGPYTRLVLRNVTLIDGTGAPPVGPVDVVIEKNRIVSIHSSDRSPKPAKQESGTHEMNLAGMYVLPGLINMHTHIGPVTRIPAEYLYKLWMGHGITTIREVWCQNGVDWVLGERDRSAKNEITAPRIKAYCHISMDQKGPFTDAASARKQVDALADRGVDGLKFTGLPPDQFQEALDEAQNRGFGTPTHL